MLDAPRHPELLLHALSLDPLLLQTLPSQFGKARAPTPLLSDLGPLYAMDTDGHVNQFLATGRKAHELPSIVGGVHDEAAHHLVVCGYLVLEVYAGVGGGGRELGVGPFFAFAVGLLVGKQFG